MPKCTCHVTPVCEAESFQAIWACYVVDRLLNFWILSTLLIGAINLPKRSALFYFIFQCRFCQESLLCSEELWVIVRWVTEQKASKAPSPAIFMPFFSKSQSLLSMYTFLASYHPFFLSTSVTFLWLAPLPPHSIHHHLHLGCSGAPVVSARDKRMRAPGGPRLPCRTSVTLSQSRAHTGTCPPLSREGSVLGCYGNLGKVSLSWPDCVELRSDGALMAPAILCHAELCHAG